MAATKFSASVAGYRATNAVVVLAEVNQLTIKTGHLSHIVVWNVGTTFTVDVYDTANATTTGTKVWSWVSADGKGTFPLQVPISAGIYVVTTGTPGGLDIVYA